MATHGINIIIIMNFTNFDNYLFHTIIQQFCKTYYKTNGDICYIHQKQSCYASALLELGLLFRHRIIQLHRGLKMSPSFISLRFLRKLTNFYNIWHTVYRVKLQRNNYWFTRLTYVLLLQYLEKQVNCIIITLATKSYTLPLHKIKKYTVYTHNRSALEPKHYSKCSTDFRFHTHRPEVFYAIHHSSITMLCNERQSSAASGLPRLELASMIHSIILVSYFREAPCCYILCQYVITMWGMAVTEKLISKTCDKYA